MSTLSSKKVLDTGAQGTALVAGVEKSLLTSTPGKMTADFQRALEVEAAAAVLSSPRHSRDLFGAVHASGDLGCTRVSPLPSTVHEDDHLLTICASWSWVVWMNCWLALLPPICAPDGPNPWLEHTW